MSRVEGADVKAESKQPDIDVDPEALAAIERDLEDVSDPIIVELAQVHYEWMLANELVTERWDKIEDRQERYITAMRETMNRYESMVGHGTFD